MSIESVLIQTDQLNLFLYLNDDKTKLKVSNNYLPKYDLLINAKLYKSFHKTEDEILSFITEILRNSEIKCEEFVCFFLKKKYKAFVIGKFVNIKNAYFYVNEDHEVSSKGKIKEVDLGILNLIYKEAKVSDIKLTNKLNHFEG